MNAETKAQLQDIANILQPAVDEGRVEVHGLKPRVARTPFVPSPPKPAEGHEIIKYGVVARKVEEVSKATAEVLMETLTGSGARPLEIHVIAYGERPTDEVASVEIAKTEQTVPFIDRMLEQVSDLARHRHAQWEKLDNARAEIHELEVKLEREQLKTADCITRRELERALEVEPDSFTMAQLLARLGNLVSDLDDAHSLEANRRLQAVEVKGDGVTVRYGEQARPPVAKWIAEGIADAIRGPRSFG